MTTDFIVRVNLRTTITAITTITTTARYLLLLPVLLLQHGVTPPPQSSRFWCGCSSDSGSGPDRPLLLLVPFFYDTAVAVLLMLAVSNVAGAPAVLWHSEAATANTAPAVAAAAPS